MSELKILAGKKALQHIRANGLSPQDVTAVFGASGAAKWLTIYGLDKAIFSQWLVKAEHKIDLFGTSVGAFKLAAAAQPDAATALTRLADAYINQQYNGEINPDKVNRETRRILDAFLSQQSVADILASKRFNYCCGSVRCLGGLTSDNETRQKLAMVVAFMQSLLGRRYLRGSLERAVFYSGTNANEARHTGEAGRFGGDGFKTHAIALSENNFSAAVLSSGSIPVIMPGISAIPAAPQGVYRDGGLLDYHAVPANIVDDFAKPGRGLVLYPHFYRYLKESWFDKFFPWRKVAAEQLDNVVLVSPSAEFVAALPGGEIPDRNDFYRFSDNDDERIRRWAIAKNNSEILGSVFLDLVQSGDIASVIEPL